MTADVERKVRRLDNDVQAIYEILSQVEASQHKVIGTQQRHGNRLDEIDGRLGGVDDRLGGIDGRLGGIDGKLDQIGGQLTEVLEALHRGND